jgi:hypothetical protein
MEHNIRIGTSPITTGCIIVKLKILIIDAGKK